MIADSRERMTAIYLVQTASENSLSSMADSQPTICNNDGVKIGQLPAIGKQKPAEFYYFLFSELGFVAKGPETVANRPCTKTLGLNPSAKSPWTNRNPIDQGAKRSD